MASDRNAVTLITDAEVGATAVAIGSLIGGRYLVLNWLGSGGMADVYEVEHRELQRRFALKLLRADVAQSASLKARFEREVRTVASLVSDCIVAIVDCGTTERGAPYFVMERLYGLELRRLLQSEGPLPVQRVLRLGTDACQALQVAHAAGVVHRDLKPENLFVVQNDAQAERCKVLDFGVAKLSGENPTLPGTLVGTARYMAPEQIGSGAEIGPATDIFALGVILFECLSGEPPFNGDSFERVLYKIVNEPTPDLRQLRPELLHDLVHLIERMLAKEPSQRPKSVLEVRAELQAHLTEPAPHSSAVRWRANESTLVKSRVRSLGSLSVGLGVGIVLGTALGAWVMRPDPAALPVGATTADASAVATAPPSSVTLEPSAESVEPPLASTLPPTAARNVEIKPLPRPTSTAASPSTTAPSAIKPPLFFPDDAK